MKRRRILTLIVCLHVLVLGQLRCPRRGGQYGREVRRSGLGRRRRALQLPAPASHHRSPSRTFDPHSKNRDETITTTSRHDNYASAEVVWEGNVYPADRWMEAYCLHHVGKVG